MPAVLVPIAAIAGFVLVAALVGGLNEHRPVDVGGLFPVDGREDWPQRVPSRVHRFAPDRRP